LLHKTWKVKKQMISIHGKNDFEKSEKFKILLDTDLKIILLDCQNNYVKRSNVMSNIVKNVDILATNFT